MVSTASPAAPDTVDALVDAFIARWDGTERAERANYIPFLNELCDLLGVPRPEPATWPDAEFIVGNPPFVAGKDMRQELGDGYAGAVGGLSKVPRSADVAPSMPQQRNFVREVYAQ